MNTHEWLAKYKLQDKLPEWWTRVEGYGCHIACPMKDILTWKLVWRQDRYNYFNKDENKIKVELENDPRWVGSMRILT